MLRILSLHRILMAIVVLLLIAMSAWADLQPVVQETGRISVSVDAVGTNAAFGVVQVEKPVGGTVRKAFLSCASNFFRVINDCQGLDSSDT